MRIEKKPLGERPNLRCNRLHIVFVLFGLISAVALRSRGICAGLGAWKPVFAGYSSTLSLQSSYATNDRKTNQGMNSTSTRQAFRESLQMKTVGYVYHPDLLVFNLSGTYGEDQSRVTPDDEQASGRGGYEAYELEGRMFREKPYKVQFFSQQETPFSSSAQAEDVDGTVRESGGEVTYKKGPYGGRLNYRNTSHLTGNSSRTIDDYDARVDVTRPKLGVLDQFMTTGLASYQEEVLGVSGLLGGRKTITQAESFDNSFGLTIFHFTTGMNLSTARTGEGTALGYSSDQMAFSEGVGIDLPWGFDSRLNYVLSRGSDHNAWTTFTNGQEMATAMQSDAANDNDNLDFSLTHKLYQSLHSQLHVRHNATQTDRTDQSQDASGNAIMQEPVKGESAQESAQARTQYDKVLPHGSGLTSSVFFSSNQVRRIGLSAEPVVYASVADHGGIIHLSDITDLNASIIVEVLKDKITCSGSVKNPHALTPECWIPLVKTIDYELLPGSLDMKVNVLSDGHVSPDNGYSLALNYDSFKTQELAYAFTFRVTSYLKAADATAQTAGADLGLTLFKFVSSRYQHSVTSQEGTYASERLLSNVTNDTASLHVTLDSLFAGASQQWIRSDVQQTITRFWASYSITKSFFDLLSVKFECDAHTGRGDAISDSGDSAQASENGYSYAVHASMPVKLITASLSADHRYVYSNGAIDSLALNSEGISTHTQDLGIGNRTNIHNSIGINKPFAIPWLEFVANSYARYDWDTSEGDTNTSSSHLLYGVRAGRSWVLGGTTINLNANYAIAENLYDDGITAINVPGMGSERDEQTNITSVMLSLIRRLH